MALPTMKIICWRIPPQLQPKNQLKQTTILRAPKGDYALAQINNDIYVVTIPYVGAEGAKINVKDASKAAFPSRKLTKFGGQFPSWNSSGNIVYWTLGKTLFRYDIAAAKANENAQKEEKEAKEAAKKEEKDENESETDEAVASAETDEEEEDDSIEDYQAKELDLIVKANRAIAKGTLVLQNATLITMKGDEIIQNGTVVITNNRITAVGTANEIEVPALEQKSWTSKANILSPALSIHMHICGPLGAYIKTMFGSMPQTWPMV